ncbi:hypothetical protein Tco_0099567 [Tanacetum coccineum]
MGTKVTSSSGSVLEEPEIQKLQMQAKIFKENSLNKLNALKTTIQHLSSSNHSMYYEFREAFHRLFDANEGLFRSVLSRNMQNLEMQFSNETLHEKDSNSELRAIKGQFEHFIHSKMFELSKYNTNAREILQDFNAYTTMEAQTFKETIIQNMDSIEQCIIERASHEQELKMTFKNAQFKKLKHWMLFQKTKQKRVAWYLFKNFIHSSSKKELHGIFSKTGFKHAFATLFGQDVETFIGTMFLNVDQLEKQLDKEEFQEIGSIASFKVLETQFQMFIKSRIYLDDEYVDMIRNKFLQYTRLEIPEFRDTLIQHMESVKKSIDERAKHKEEYDSWVNERQIQTTEDKDTSSRSGNDAHADDADIRPIYDEESMVMVYNNCIDDINIFATETTAYWHT